MACPGSPRGSCSRRTVGISGLVTGLVMEVASESDHAIDCNGLTLGLLCLGISYVLPREAPWHCGRGCHGMCCGI